jgi:hypothetical protein
VGAGPGFLAPIVREYGGDYHGFDTRSNDLIADLQAANGATGGVVDFTFGPDGEMLPGSPFDAIVCGWITFGDGWTVDDWASAIVKLFLSLNPGGRLVLRFNEDRLADVPVPIREMLDNAEGAKLFDGGCGFVLQNV